MKSSRQIEKIVGKAQAGAGRATDERILTDAEVALTNYSDGQLSGDFSAYTRNVTIVEVDPDDDDAVDDFLDASPGSGYARVTVIVSWSSGTEQVKLETLIANYTMP